MADRETLVGDDFDVLLEGRESWNPRHIIRAEGAFVAVLGAARARSASELGILKTLIC